MKDPRIAIVGATGVVGSEMLSILGERKVPYSEIRLLASADSAGEVYALGSDEFQVEELTDRSFEGVDIALFATSASLAEKYVPIAVEAGAKVVDNSTAFRLDPHVPLVVPEVNGDLVMQTSSQIIANPNCTTAQLVPVLNVIAKEVGIERVVVSTYQAVSGAGKAALDELFEHTRAVFTQKELERKAFQHPIAFNCIPQIDLFLDSGYTKEEQKVIDESRKILGLPELRITCTAVRVPVFHAHAESVNVETTRELTPERFSELLQAADGITPFPRADEFPMQVDAAGDDSIYVGRIRKDESVPCGLNMWIVADNIRKGAALNAVQIVELLLDRSCLT